MNIFEERFAPTPLYLLDTDEHGNRIFVKREDLLPYSFGGNKVRIGVEYLRDMRRKGCTHLLAYGNARSNLCRVLSNLCAGLQTPITILCPADDDGQQREAFNGRLCAMLGARVIPCRKTNVAQSVEHALADIVKTGDNPYYIYGDCLGRGNEAVPTAAYVPMYAELAAQGKALHAAFDTVFLATGTGMTQAGLLCGQTMAGEAARSWRVVGVSTAREARNARAHILSYANAYLSGRDECLSEERIEVFDDFRGVYGHYDAAVDACIRDAMTRYGLPLDGAYTAKAFCGMREWMRRRRFEGRDVLFVHTGGTPLFFDAAKCWAVHGVDGRFPMVDET